MNDRRPVASSALAVAAFAISLVGLIVAIIAPYWAILAIAAGIVGLIGAGIALARWTASSVPSRSFGAAGTVVGIAAVIVGVIQVISDGGPIL